MCSLAMWHQQTSPDTRRNTQTQRDKLEQPRDQEHTTSSSLTYGRCTRKDRRRSAFYAHPRPPNQPETELSCTV